MVVETTFNTGSVSIHFAEGPPGGTPLVLLHGVTMWWQDFLAIMPALAFRYHLYAPDFRGHGSSARVPGGYRFEEYAQDILALLREQIGEPAILLGHSLGAMVAIQVAAQAPEWVRALVLEDPPLYSHSGEGLRAMPVYEMFLAVRGLTQTEYALDAWLPELARLWPEGNAAGLRAWAKSLSLIDPDVVGMIIDGRATDHYDTDALLPRIECPMLLLRGDPALGGMMTDDAVAHATSLLRQCTMVSVPGAGHSIRDLQPEMFRRAVSDFLESL